MSDWLQGWTDKASREDNETGYKWSASKKPTNSRSNVQENDQYYGRMSPM